MATNIDWDSTLPQLFEQQGYNEGDIQNLITTTMNGGPAKSRPKSTEAYQTIKGTMLLSHAQKATFESFYKDTLAWGALSFKFPEPYAPASTFEAKILSRPIVPVNGKYWRLTLSLQRLIA